MNLIIHKFTFLFYKAEAENPIVQKTVVTSARMKTESTIQNKVIAAKSRNKQELITERSHKLGEIPKYTRFKKISLIVFSKVKRSCWF